MLIYFDSWLRWQPQPARDHFGRQRGRVSSRTRPSGTLRRQKSCPGIQHLLCHFT